MTKKKPQNRLKEGVHAVNNRRKEFLRRRPHRSFRRTLRRDYRRSMKLPGYWALTVEVSRTMFRNWRIFVSLAIIYIVIALALSSFVSQETYASLKEVVDEVNEDGSLGSFLSSLTLFWGVMSGQLTGSSSDSAGSPQQIVGALSGLFVWLSTVWLLRNIMAGGKPKTRDGIYSSGGPVIALAVLVFVLLIQMIPAAVALIAYNAASSSGLFDQTAVLMLFGGAAVLLVTLSVYWAVSTVIAMVIVALPGMYPFQALKLAGDLVVGRRIRILLRMAWFVVLLVIVWAAILIPVIVLDGVLKSALPDLSWLPLVPIVALILMACSVIVMASYVYIFYRKVVEDDSAPA